MRASVLPFRVQGAHLLKLAAGCRSRRKRVPLTRMDVERPPQLVLTIGFAAMADAADLDDIVAGRDEEKPVIADP
jgi:hypothetical protein